MKKVFKYSLYLLIISLLIVAGSQILNLFSNIGITFCNITWLTACFCFTNILCLYIFLKGQQKENKSQPFFTLVSTSLKFLIELIIALLWFIIAKKTSISFIILFFVLYLTFTSFSIFMILKTLKNKSL